MLKADVKVAMTGTPVENRLTELWSIFDFINKGYLGSLKEFQKVMLFQLKDLRKIQELANLECQFRHSY